MTRVSNVLGSPCLAEGMRYESDGKHKYRLKHPGEVRQLRAALSRFVKATSRSLPRPLVPPIFSRFRNCENVR